MNPTEEKAMQRAWCQYRGIEYVEGSDNPQPSDNFAKGYECGRRDALAGQWIDCKERLPEVDRESFNTGVSLFLVEDFLVYVGHGNGSFDHFIANRKKFGKTEWLWWDCENDCEIKNVVYWMPVPKLPK